MSMNYRFPGTSLYALNIVLKQNLLDCLLSLQKIVVKILHCLYGSNSERCKSEPMLIQNSLFSSCDKIS